MTVKPLLFITIFLVPSLGFSQSKSEVINSAKTTTRVSWIGFDEVQAHEFSLWGGYAFDSYRFWGKTPDATIGQLGIGYNRKFLRIGNQILKYRFTLNLFSKITYPEFEPGRNRTSLSGFGITPLGLRSNFFAGNKLQPFLDASGGMIVFNDPFPDIRGKKFNYTLGIGGGLEYLLNARSSLSFGYKYFHISNGERGQVNPGIDSSFFFLALTIF
ncbi:acyloxyacyl hydrolase [Balneolaceae bacterium YR4-1]|uniref:Acyloxyacyl hydrolase n=1 Tax=Halalkalibaculum roseum TaxID=2709311 RepID=A0A6M1SWM3_9BACT|nr:acyloxyacyl hydrolase [Halalkalibaculum roseum]NGP76476.1 acyloxyacyl hydrolase [Halalkalibaculum roseum]